MADWLKVLSGEVPESELIPILTEAAGQLEILLKSDPETTDRVLGIVHKHVSAPAGPETWDRLMDALRAYLGEAPMYLMVWSRPENGRSDNLTLLEQHASSAVMRFFRTVVATYGRELEQMFSAWKELPNNWESLTRDVFLDQLTGLFRVVLRIRKYSQEEMLIEGPPDSVLNLAITLIDALRPVHETDALSDERVDAFLSEACRLAILRKKSDLMLDLLRGDASATAQAPQ